MKGLIRFIADFFPQRASTLEEFAYLVQEQGCTKVRMENRIEVEGGALTIVVGHIGNWHEVLHCMAFPANKRNIVFREKLLSRFGSAEGFADAVARRDQAIRSFLMVERRMQRLQALLPEHVIVSLEGPTGETMDEDMFTRLHRDAEAFEASL